MNNKLERTCREMILHNLRLLSWHLPAEFEENNKKCWSGESVPQPRFKLGISQSQLSEPIHPVVHACFKHIIISVVIHWIPFW